MTILIKTILVLLTFYAVSLWMKKVHGKFDYPKNMPLVWFQSFLAWAVSLAIVTL